MSETSPNQSNQLKIYTLADPKKVIELQRQEAQKALNLIIGIKLFQALEGQLWKDKIVTKEDIVGVYRQVFEMFFKSVKQDSRLLDTLEITDNQSFDEEIFKKLLRATFQNNLSSEKGNAWKPGKYEQNTLRFVVDLIVCCCDDLSTETVKKFLNSYVKNLDTQEVSFIDILDAVYKQYNLNGNENNPEFTKLPVYIEALENDTVTPVSNIDTLHTRLNTRNLIPELLSLVLRLYTEQRPVPDNQAENTTNSPEEPSNTSSKAPGNLELLDQKPPNILSEKITQIEEIFDRTDLNVANMLRQIGSPEFIKFLYDTLFADNSLYFLAKTEENKKALDEFMANYFRVESKQGIIGNSNLIDGIIVLWGVLSCLDIFCSQILDINDKQSANQNSWVRNINNIKVLEKAMVGVLSNLPPEEDITALKWLFNEYLNSTIDIKPQGFGSKPTIKKEKPVDYQAKIKGLKNFLTEFTNLENHKFIMDNVFNELFEIITSLNVINMTLEDFLRLHLFHGSVKIEPPLPINLTEMVNKHRINSTSLENILNIQTTHFWLLESPELLDKIGMSELQPFLDEIKKIIKRAQEIYQSLASNNVKNIETATNERLSIQITLRLLEVYIALAKIINNSNPNMSVNFRNTANRNIPMSYIAKLTITNAEEYEKYLD